MITSILLLLGVGAILHLWHRELVSSYGAFLFWSWIAALAYMFARPAVLALGLDTPFPDGAIPSEDRTAALNSGLILVALWLAFSGVATWLVARRPVRPWTPSPPPNRDQALVYTAGVAGFGAACLLIVLIVRLGGPSVAIGALKRDELGSNSQLFALAKNAGLMATMAGAATVVSAVRAGRPWWTTGARLGLVILPAGLTFTVGARDAAVFGAVAIVSSTFHQGSKVSPRMFLRIVGAFTLVLILGVGLRLGRDLAFSAGVSDNVANQSVVRQLSITANMTAFDAMAHARYITPTEFDLAGISDFVASIQSLPLVPGEPSADYQKPAVRIIRHHLPTRINGNPLSPIGDWYIGLGLGGVLLGALLSGALLGELSRRFAAAGTDALIHVIGVVTALRILPLGIGATTPSVGLQFAISTLGLVALLGVITRYLCPTSSADRDGLATSSPLSDNPPKIATVLRIDQPSRPMTLIGIAIVVVVTVASAGFHTGVTSRSTIALGEDPASVFPAQMANALDRVGTTPLNEALTARGLPGSAHASSANPNLVISTTGPNRAATTEAADVVVETVLAEYPTARVVAANTPVESRGTPWPYTVLAVLICLAALLSSARVAFRGLSRIRDEGSAAWTS